MSDPILWDARYQGNDASDVSRFRRHGDVAEDDLIDLLGPHAGALQYCLGRQPAKLVSRHASQWTECLGKRRPDAFHYGDVEHDRPATGDRALLMNERPPSRRRRFRQASLSDDQCACPLPFVRSRSRRRWILPKKFFGNSLTISSWRGRLCLLRWPAQ